MPHAVTKTLIIVHILLLIKTFFPEFLLLLPKQLRKLDCDCLHLVVAKKQVSFSFRDFTAVIKTVKEISNYSHLAEDMSWIECH